MSPNLSGPEDGAERLRRITARIRPAHLVAAGTTLFAFAVGLAGLTAVASSDAGSSLAAQRMQIEVIAPVETEFSPGSVMEVGDLVDGFDGVPEPPVVEAVAKVGLDEWKNEIAPPPRPVARFGEAEIRVPPQPEPAPPVALERGSRWFGFDAPSRDYRSEREARRQARDERQRRREMARRDDGRDADRWVDDQRRPEDARWYDRDTGRETAPRGEGGYPERWR